MKVLSKLMVGSHLFGLNTETSDIDLVEIIKVDNDEMLGLQHSEEVQINKDYKQYEIGKFIKLLAKGNPNMLEILFAEDLLSTSEEWELLREQRHSFLTKQLFYTFSKYAITQLNKSKGLNKKINWEEEHTKRRTVLDFCHVYDIYERKDFKLHKFLEFHNITQNFIGLSKMNNFKDCYYMYFDFEIQKERKFNFNGIVSSLEANDVNLSKIESFYLERGILYFNKDAYSRHCKMYKDYQNWLKTRNEDRYNTNKEHSQKYDSKNIMHLTRLLNLSEKIAKFGTFENKVGEEEKEYLLSIKKGEIELKKIVENVNNRINEIEKLYSTANLPEDVDLLKVNDLLIQLRKISN